MRIHSSRNAKNQMDRLDDLNLFVRVAELGSITAAARDLDLSLSVASQRLKRLEQRLGVRLLYRTTRRLKLTEEGAALLEQGRPLLEDLDALTSGLKRAGREITGTLRVTMPAAFGTPYVSPLLPRFLARHPPQNIHMAVAARLPGPAPEGRAVAGRIGTRGGSRLGPPKIAPTGALLGGAPRFRRRRGTPRRPDPLTRHECLVLVGRRGPID